MTWPLPAFREDYANDTIQLDEHPNVHNAIGDALNELGVRTPSSAELYTPVLSGITVGTGGTNEARWQWLGGPSIGDIGHLLIAGQIILGTSGFSFTDPVMHIPSGFASIDYSGVPCGACRFTDVAPGSAYLGLMRRSTSTGIRPRILGVNGLDTNPSATAPFTWAAGDQLMWQATVLAARA